jgi:mevalonate pyrophosphate decarboxylase
LYKGKLDDLIQYATEANAIPPATSISLAVDAMAVTAEWTHVPSADCETTFVIDGQPLDARLKCPSLHLMTDSSGRALVRFKKRLNESPGR